MIKWIDVLGHFMEVQIASTHNAAQKESVEFY